MKINANSSPPSIFTIQFLAWEYSLHELNLQDNLSLHFEGVLHYNGGYFSFFFFYFHAPLNPIYTQPIWTLSTIAIVLRVIQDRVIVTPKVVGKFQAPALIFLHKVTYSLLTNSFPYR